jgi:hypothetical protein
MQLWNLGIGIVTKQVEGLTENAVGRTRFAMSQAVRDSLAMIESEHKERQIRRSGSSTARPDPNTWTTRKGNLRRSFHIDWSPGRVTGAYGSDLERSYKVERGGKIQSDRPGGSLAIPTKFAPQFAWPRNMPDLFFKKSKTGKPYLAQVQGGKLRPMFLLRKSVTLPPRPALDRAIEATEAARRKRFIKAVDLTLERTR